MFNYLPKADPLKHVKIPLPTLFLEIPPDIAPSCSMNPFSHILSISNEKS